MRKAILRSAMSVTIVCVLAVLHCGCRTGRLSADKTSFTVEDITILRNLVAWFLRSAKHEGHFEYHFPNTEPERRTELEKPFLRDAERILARHKDRIPISAYIGEWRLYGEFDKATEVVTFQPHRKAEAESMVVGITRPAPDEVFVIVELPWCQMAFKLRPAEKEPRRLEFVWCI